MPATQQDIARCLKLSQRTVSVAFGAAGRIHPQTRQRILRTAQELGYQPNHLAAGLRGSSTRSVGLVWRFVNPWSGDAPIGLDLLQRLQRQGLATYQAQRLYNVDPDQVCRQLDDLLARRVDGVVLEAEVHELRNPQIVQRLRAARAVVAMTSEPVAGFPGDLLVHDRTQAIEAVVDHFARTGRKRPAMMTDLNEPTNPPKFDVFRRRCQDHGIADHPHLLIRRDVPAMAEENGQSHIDALRRQFPGNVEVDAIFCFNDTGALAILRELQDRGLNVPQDVAVVGFNNIELGRLWRPALASGDRKCYQVAQAIDQMLQARLAHPDLPPQRMTIHMEFVWRESAGGPAPPGTHRPHGVAAA